MSNPSAPNTEVFNLAGGEIALWVDGGIHLKLNNKYKDPVEIGEENALELANLLIRLVKEQRE
jgi:hypothetical protein